MPERKARQAVGAGTADCGWGTATRRPCGSGDAERNLKRPRVRENIARRSTPVGKTPGRCKHRVGNGVRRRPRWGVPADPKWAGPITGPGPGRRPDAVSWPRMRARWYRRAAEARAGGDGVRPSRGTESRALTNRSTGRSGRAMARAALRRGRRSDTRRSARPPRRAGSGGPQATRRRNQARRGGRAGPVGRHGKPRCDN